MTDYEKRQEHLRRKAREYKAKSRQREKQRSADIDLIPPPNLTTEVRREGILGDCAELSEALKAECKLTPANLYKTTEEFLKDIFQKYPDYEWFMKYDPRVKVLLETVRQMGKDDQEDERLAEGM